jgi:hypothetical protein
MLLIGIHLFCCAHGRKCTATHDVVRDFFAFIDRDARFNVLCEQTHVLPTLGGIRILANVVIVGMIHAFLVSLSTFSRGLGFLTTTIVTHAKVVSYCDRHPEDDFISLVVKIFGYLHQ